MVDFSIVLLKIILVPCVVYMIGVTFKMMLCLDFPEKIKYDFMVKLLLDLVTPTTFSAGSYKYIRFHVSYS